MAVWCNGHRPELTYLEQFLRVQIPPTHFFLNSSKIINRAQYSRELRVNGIAMILTRPKNILPLFPPKTDFSHWGQCSHLPAYLTFEDNTHKIATLLTMFSSSSPFLLTFPPPFPSHVPAPSSYYNIIYRSIKTMTYLTILRNESKLQ